MSEHTDFEDSCDFLRLESSEFLKTWFGPKCEDFEPNCECCQRWKALETLFNNPFDEE